MDFDKELEKEQYETVGTFHLKGQKDNKWEIQKL